jgi:CRISPR-associated protein Cas1
MIEIATDGKHLSVSRGFMLVEENKTELARVPLDDIMAVIGAAHGLTFSNHLLVELAKRNAPLVLCGSNFTPVAFLWSLEGNYRQSARMDAQIASTLPKSKQLWKQIVQAKIAQQAATLEAAGGNAVPVLALMKEVKSGDTSNVEAQAARRYWPLLLGRDFRRDRQSGGTNALLNYGYMILRSAVARSLMGAGLHPSIGLHHSHSGNPMRLVDDLMEPYRPFIDFVVWRLEKEGSTEITPPTKTALVGVLELNVETTLGMTSLRTAVQETATTLALIYEDKKKTSELFFPLPQAPLWRDRTEKEWNLSNTADPADVDDRDV